MKSEEKRNEKRVLSSVQNENTPQCMRKLPLGTGKANALRGVKFVKEKVGRGRPRGVRRPKDATSK
jgi:hypothetical protein